MGNWVKFNNDRNDQEGVLADYSNKPVNLDNCSTFFPVDSRTQDKPWILFRLLGVKEAVTWEFKNKADRDKCFEFLEGAAGVRNAII